ncbi:hypothetical protein E1262_27995 [Jiangella aurantiaca]|uniref:Uncharacterized protein n=1 Tax=Jiangella aurantiaca TaxID=2530373 RepID=A0A4R4ZYV0_9ACTN|nr:hypothetical protein [Jiangella aurantiaca]TDD64493.1 hypothetical protein E1262_27995 [Jiangella aurantiaca]
MTDPMTALVRRAARHSDDEIATLTGSAAEADLLARILAEPAPVHAPAVSAGTTHGRRPRRNARRLVRLVGVAAAAAVGVTVLVSVQGDRDRVVWATEALEMADQTPRLLIDANGWRVEDADQIEPGEGTMMLTDGEHHLHLRWDASADFDAMVANREENAASSDQAVVAGHEAVTLTWPDDERNTIWQQNDFVVEMLTWRSPMSDDEYADVLAAITQVDAGTWLSALPGDVIRAEDAVAVAEEMLGGAALPDGLAFTEPAGAISRHQLSYTVENEARCAWIEEWIRATDAGEEVAAATATTAIAGIPDWPVQSEIHGHDQAAFWTDLNRIVDDGILPGGRDLVVSGDTEVEGWRALFSCHQPALLG